MAALPYIISLFNKSTFLIDSSSLTSSVHATIMKPYNIDAGFKVDVVVCICNLASESLNFPNDVVLNPHWIPTGGDSIGVV